MCSCVAYLNTRNVRDVVITEHDKIEKTTEMDRKEIVIYKFANKNNYISDPYYPDSTKTLGQRWKKVVLFVGTTLGKRYLKVGCSL